LKAYGICVFADIGANGFYNPIFENEGGEIVGYELIPIPEDEKRGEGPRYDQIIGTTGRPLSDFIPSSRTRWLQSHPYVHFDPDLVHKTYGDNNSNPDHPSGVPRMLSKLERGDLLVIFARMQKWVNNHLIEGTGRVYIVGWIEIDKIINFQTSTDEEITHWLNEHRKMNSHFLNHKGSIESFRDWFDIVAIGNSKVGGQLKKPILLTGGRENNKNGRDIGFPILPEMRDLIADNHRLVRMIGPYELHYELINNLLQDPANDQFVSVQLPSQFL